jgi:hypothetical protein
MYSIFTYQILVPFYTSLVTFSLNSQSDKRESLFSHGPNKAFLVPDSCRATERNSISISTDITEDTIEYD